MLPPLPLDCRSRRAEMAVSSKQAQAVPRLGGASYSPTAGPAGGANWRRSHPSDWHAPRVGNVAHLRTWTWTWRSLQAQGALQTGRSSLWRRRLPPHTDMDMDMDMGLMLTCLPCSLSLPRHPHWRVSLDATGRLGVTAVGLPLGGRWTIATQDAKWERPVLSTSDGSSTLGLRLPAPRDESNSLP